MFEEAVPEQAEKRVPTKKSDTAVIATVFIGIGNKPFLRGSGAGLTGTAEWLWNLKKSVSGAGSLRLNRRGPLSSSFIVMMRILTVRGNTPSSQGSSSIYRQYFKGARSSIT